MATGDKLPVVMSRDRAVPGGVATLDETGILTAAQRPNLAQVGGRNQNLLENGFFLDPINQRGKTEYAGTMYGIDRWFNSMSGKITLTDNGIIFGPSVMLDQRIEKGLLHTGLIYTLSIFVSGKVYSYTGKMLNGNWSLFNLGNSGFKTRFLTQTNSYSVISIYTSSDFLGTDPIQAVKCELGPTQTLAHQDDDGNLVLNDSPSNKALELAKCQRYQNIGSLCAPYLSTSTNNYIYCFLPLPTTLRSKPTIYGTPTVKKVSDSTAVTGAIVEVYDVCNDGVYFRLSGINEPVFLEGPNWGVNCNL